MKKKKKTAAVILALVAIFAAAAVVYALVTGMDAPKNKGQEETKAGEEKNILVLGLDARDGGTGRTDTIMAVNVDPSQGKIHIISIPRDTRVDLKGSYDRINAAYVYGGIDLTRKTVEELLGIKIDNYAIIHFQGLVKVVDLLGGVEVNVPERMYRPSEDIDLQPGRQVLNGEDVLAFARYRYTKNGDLDRARHQQEILEALRKKVVSPGVITKIPELVAIASEYIDTDMNREELMDMASAAEKFKGQELETQTLPGEVVKIDGLWYYLADEKKLEEISLPFKKVE